MGAMRPLHGFLIVSLLAACAAPSQWSKPGASDTAMADDLQQCRIQTRLAPQESILAVPSAQTSSSPMLDRSQERDAQEEKEVRDCMQKKGYSLKR